VTLGALPRELSAMLGAVRIGSSLAVLGAASVVLAIASNS